MNGIAGNSHAFSFDYKSLFCDVSYAGPQLKKQRPCSIALEHRPVFEEGQRLSQDLVDSLLSSYRRNIAAGLAAGNVSKEVLENRIGGAARRKHHPADKGRSGRDRGFQRVKKDSNGACYRDCSDLFSFDDLPVYVEDEDDVDYMNTSSSASLAARKLSGKDSRTVEGCASTGNSFPQKEHETAAWQRAPRGISEDESKRILRFDTLHDSNSAYEWQIVDEASPQRNDCPENSIQLRISLQCAEKPRFQLERKQQCINDAYNFTDSEEFSSPEMCIVSSQQHTLVKYIPYNFTHGDESGSPGMGDVIYQQCSSDNHDPSLLLGRAFNQFHFARSYNLVALRVSLAECETLANRLKGHLLNWPRISNIARVQGDDLNWDTKSLRAISRRGKEEGLEDSILQAVYGTLPRQGQMEKRAKSAKKLISNRFRYLECISRPGCNAVEEMKEHRERQLNKSKHRSENYYMVELQNSCENEKLCLNTHFGLLGYNSKRWRGPFRLLLLDPIYAKQARLPTAVQMLLDVSLGCGKGVQRREIVPCRLTLFYHYWSMEEIINSLLPSQETTPLSITVLGHVAVLCLGEQYSTVKFCIGKVILDKHRPVVKTVVNKTEQAEAYRLPALEVLAGNHSLVTTIYENDTQFLINLAKVHWDSELAIERGRLIQTFSNKDIVCDVLAGAGGFTLPLAKKVWRVFANDPNMDAVKYLAINIDNNRLHAKVEVYNLDCCLFLRKLLAFKRPVVMTQIVFGQPTTVDSVIDALRGAFIQETWPADQALPTVHVYGYRDKLNPHNDFVFTIMEKLRLAHDAVKSYSIEPSDSGRCLVCASFQLPCTLAFDSR